MTSVLDISEVARQSLRACVPRAIYSMGAEVLNAFVGAARVGPGTYSRLRRIYPNCTQTGSSLVRFDLPQLRHPFYVRPGSTDAIGLMQNVVRGEWGGFIPPGPVRLIVDAGANCGDTTSWYLSKFSDATVAALEPDPANYAMLQRNCGPYGPRAILLNAALWSRPTGLRIHRSPRTDGFSVGEAGPGAVIDCRAVTVPTLLSELGREVIDILKMDIEGAEREVFSSNAEKWLPSVRCLAIELHGSVEEQFVYNAIQRHRFHVKRYRNTHIFWQ